MSSSLTELVEFANRTLNQLPADVLVDLDERDRDLLKGKILIHSIQQGTISNSTLRVYVNALLEQKGKR